MADSTHTETEPTSPAWLPVVGIVLFLAFGAWLALGPSSEPAAQPAAAAH
jgi:hypothetical protein